jgi:hypothetical protein
MSFFNDNGSSNKVRHHCLVLAGTLFLFLLPASALFAQTEDTVPKSSEVTEALDAVESEDPAEPAETESPLGGEGPVELNGDYVEFIRSENKFIAEGNVIIKRGGITLYCDRLEFLQEEQVAVAEGNVILETVKEERVLGDRLVYNFGTMTGVLNDATVYSAPFYGAGETIAKVGENHLTVEEGYITTCDHDKPHYRIRSRKIDIHPGEKAVARNIRLFLGNLPLLYLPKYTQNLTDQRPFVVFTPGYDKDWGFFVLSQWRYYMNENLKGTVHLDYRERKDVASGVDLDYNTLNFGKGIIRTYYMNERNITSKRVFEERPSPTIERERFKIEWRHKWDIDEKTDAILQYYKLSDSGLLRDYFESESIEDPSPGTFFLFTHLLPHGVFSFQTDWRVNRFVGATERLPEIQYNLANQKVGNTNFYFKNISTYSNLVKKEASPSEVRQQTMRFDSENEISHPLKIAFVEMRPFVGTRQTYYSKTKDTSKYSIVRGVFNTGADLSTKFYKVLDVEGNFFGVPIDRLRHIVTPSVSYKFQPDPTVPPSRLDQFDSIDAINREHSITFSLENKLQTKTPEGGNQDLLRAVVGVPFFLKEDPRKGGFNTISSEIDFHPTDWMSFYFDSDYDTIEERLSNANFDLYIRDRSEKSRWSLGVSKRLTVDVDDILAIDFTYRINPKWQFRVYQRYNTELGFLEEHEYVITRDLHEWEMDLLLNDKRNSGAEILFVFRLKAFPEIGFDAGTTINRRKKPRR